GSVPCGERPHPRTACRQGSTAPRRPPPFGRPPPASRGRRRAGGRPRDCLPVVASTPGEGDEGPDVVAPQVVEGVLVVIRNPARGQFPAVVEFQVREARRMW